MKYMVCRKEAIHGGMKTSELFPVIVESYHNDVEQIVLNALHEKWPNYTPKNKSYYVIPMNAAVLVTFKPKQDYDVFIDPVE